MADLDPQDTGQDYGTGLSGASSGGFGSKIMGLLKNKMFAQYLSAAGADMSQYGKIGPNLNKATQQNIQTQNYAKLMQHILSGGMPGAAATLNDKGLSLNIARETPVGSPGPDPGTTGIPMINKPSATSQDPANSQDSPQPQIPGGFNPFPSGLPNMSASDLAGLTPEIIQSVLNEKMQMEELKQKSYNELYERQRQSLNDASERALKSAQIKNYQSEDERRKEESQIASFKDVTEFASKMQEAPLEVPGMGKLSLEQWEKLPEKQRLYAYAMSQLPKDKQESYDDWADKSSDSTAEIKLVERSMKDPKFKSALEEIKRSGATKIDLGAEVAKESAMDQLKKTQYLGSDKFEQDIDKHIQKNAQIIRDSIPTRNAQGKPLLDDEYAAAENKATASKKKEFIEQYVQNNKGSIVNEQLVGKNLVFTIKWEAITDKAGKVVRPAKTESFTYGIFE